MSGMLSLIRFSEVKLQEMEQKGRRRQLVSTIRSRNNIIARGGKSVVSFCDNDYLSLANDPRLSEAAAYAARRFGVGSGASRLVTGNHPLNEVIEQQLATIKKTESACLFGSGYLANIGTIPALVGPGDTILIDELSHACMYAGAKLSGAEIVPFRHNNMHDAQQKMTTATGQILVLTETVFSMDGDRAPLDELIHICEANGAWLMTDDAHGFGVLNECNPAHIQMGTLSKAVGVYGGYVCGPKALVDMLLGRARSFIYTTGLPIPVLAAIQKALGIIVEEPERAVKAFSNARRFCELANLPVPESLIVPVILGEELVAMQASAELLYQGFVVAAIRPPTVPQGTSRLRITFSTGHKYEDVERLADAINRVRKSW